MMALVAQETMVALVPSENVVGNLVSRTGRHLQRYNEGRRQVVGCIPYRYKDLKQSLEISEEDLEVLVISSQKGTGRMLFPKGGWELDESIIQAASRETIEEAGVTGIVEHELGKWDLNSKEGYMFPLLVQEQLVDWPEKNVRSRIWMSVADARNVCQHMWMKEALDRLVKRLTSQQQHNEEESLGPCSLSLKRKSEHNEEESVGPCSLSLKRKSDLYIENFRRSERSCS